LHKLEEPEETLTKKGLLKDAPYPYGFDPTFHRYRLEEPQRIKKPQNIFVCSMADLFGEWVPDEWIKEVIDACKKAPQHRYLFLTKNYKRYEILISKNILPSLQYPYYFGVSITTNKDAVEYRNWRLRSINNFKDNYWINRYISAEPLQEETSLQLNWVRADWVIIGAETGNRKGKIIPKKEWLKNIIWQCYSQGGHQIVPVFMKDSLAGIWGKLIREFPWEERGA
jgi:protein gp37